MKPFRLERVRSEVRSLVSEAISNKLSDPRIAPLTSVTRVEISSDLENAKVFISVFGDDATQRRTMAALGHARGFIQTHVARALPVRQCPHLVFELDETIKKQIEISRLIDESMAELNDPEIEPDDDASAPSGDPL
jgi:ribosome-binding factor A